MKNVLYYFYQLTIHEIRRVHEDYWFEVNGYSYLFTPLTVSYEEIEAIFSLLTENLSSTALYHSIIVNKMNQIVTSFDQRNYVLFRLNITNNHQVLLDDISVHQYAKMDKKYYPITRDYWLQLWERKIDYLENEMNQVDYKFPILLESSAYYIGLGENAISYLYHVTTNSKKDSRDQTVIAHRNCSAFSSLISYYNPLTIVLDHYVRDIADYLKHIFWYDTYQIEKIKQYLKTVNLSDYGAGLLISRLLFPSMYFDLCLDILAGDRNESELSHFITRTKEFEIYFREIYNTLSVSHRLESIEWLVNATSTAIPVM